MEQNPAYKPEDHTFYHCQTLFQKLCALSETILSLSHGKDFAQLNHYILLRGLLIEQCQRMPLESFSSVEKQAIASQIALCRQVDAQIEEQMSQFQENTQRQLKHVAQSQKTLKKYYASAEQNDGFHSQDI